MRARLTAVQISDIAVIHCGIARHIFDGAMEPVLVVVDHETVEEREMPYRFRLRVLLHLLPTTGRPH